MIRFTGTDIPRGRGGNPKILVDGKHAVYKRPSSLGKVLDDQANLMAWYGRQAILGVVARPDLLRRVQTDPSCVKEVQREAHEAAGSSAAASDGTNVHDWASRLDRDPRSLFESPLEYRHALKSYLKLMEGYQVLDNELFVVDDELRMAGSLDRLVVCPDGRVRVLDIKTGRWAPTYGGRSAAVQIAVYANSRRYDPNSGERQDLHPDMDVMEGLMLHLPLAEEGEPGMYRLNLIDGYNGARLAKKVLSWRSTEVVAPVDVVPYDPSYSTV